ncbi:MAG: uncharacterized protein YwgA [Candidatus Nitrosomirales archaeon]
MTLLELKQDDLHPLAVPLLVFSGLSRIADRTQIQKLVYIVNECGWHAIKDFKFIARGPYSEWLDSQLDKWINEGMVQESEESILIDTDNEVGFYCYSLTEDGKSLANKVTDSVNTPTLVDRTLRHLRKLSKYTEQELEIVSSILYVCGEEQLDQDNIVKRILQFRPDITEEQTSKYLDVLEHTRDNIA